MQRKCTSSTSLMWSLWAAACRRIAKHIQVGSITHFLHVLYFWKAKTGGRLGIPDATAPPDRPYLVIEQLFELTRRPSRAFKRDVDVASWSHRDSTRTPSEVPGHHLKQLTQTLDYGFDKNALFSLFQKSLFW